MGSRKGRIRRVFIRAVHKLAKTCEYGDLREELIKDRIIVGMRDHRLSMKLMINEKLTLDEFIIMVNQEEEVHTSNRVWCERRWKQLPITSAQQRPRLSISLR